MSLAEKIGRLNQVRLEDTEQIRQEIRKSRAGSVILAEEAANQANSKVKMIKRTDKSAYIIVVTYTADGNLVKASIKDISDIQTIAAGADVDVMGVFDGEYAKVEVFMWVNTSTIYINKGSLCFRR